MEDNDLSSPVLKNIVAKRKQDQNLLSAEDLAWADSCLIEDPQIFETNMDSLKDALLDILDLHSEILGPSAKERGDSNDVTDPENLPTVTEAGPSHTSETSIDDLLENESPDLLFSLKKPFLPNYNDEMMNIQFSDSDDDEDLLFSKLVMEPLSGDIFKVWDLDVPVEEDDELVKQLKEALSSNATSQAPRTKGLEVESLDSLVESIADLSIK